jgi:hypothetical protein
MKGLKTLNLSPIVRIPTKDRPIQDAFEEFHEKNPHIYANLKLLSTQAYNAGRRHIGMKFFFERLRWEYMMGIEDPVNVFKLNNSYTSFYARKLIKNNKKFKDLFWTREKE